MVYFIFFPLWCCEVTRGQEEKKEPLQAPARPTRKGTRPHETAKVPACTGWCGREKAEKCNGGQPCHHPPKGGLRRVMGRQWHLTDSLEKEKEKKKKKEERKKGFAALWEDEFCVSIMGDCMGYMGLDRQTHFSYQQLPQLLWRCLAMLSHTLPDTSTNVLIPFHLILHPNLLPYPSAIHPCQPQAHRSTCEPLSREPCPLTEKNYGRFSTRTPIKLVIN